MKSLIGFVLLAIAVFVGAVLVRLGAFKTVDVRSGEAGPFRLVLRHHNGPYHKIVPVIESVEKWAAANGEACQTSFGEYLDDPSTVDEDRLNSNGGCVVQKDWNGRLPEGMSYRELPSRLYVIADFEGAPSIGPQKVYPRAARFMEAQSLKSDGPVIEMYERVAGAQQILTHYYFPVAKK